MAKVEFAGIKLPFSFLAIFLAKPADVFPEITDIFAISSMN